MLAKWGIPKYQNDEVYLIRGQFLPSYIFMRQLYAKSSFNYVNVVPHWSVFRNVFAEYVNVFLGENMKVAVSRFFNFWIFQFCNFSIFGVPKFSLSGFFDFSISRFLNFSVL